MAEDVIVVGSSGIVSDAPTRSSSRVPKPTTKVQDVMKIAENSNKVSKKATDQVTGTTTDKRGVQPGNERQHRTVSTEDMLLKLYRMLESTHNEIKSLKEVIGKQESSIKEQVNMIKEQGNTIKEQGNMIKEQGNTIKLLREQLDTITNISAMVAPAQASTHPSYADVARTPPTSHPSNLPSLSSMNTTPSTFTDTLYCTIDTSRVEEELKPKTQVAGIRETIEKEMRSREGQENWRCAAVIKDSKSADRVKVICRDETEFQLVKKAAQKTAVPGVRVLRDQLYPVKVDNANRTAVLDTDGNVLPGAAEVLGKENEVDIAKISWLSKKDTHKAYGSMLVYVTKMSHARRLLEGQYFDIAGESAYTRVFEPRTGPSQCYNCQELGHKAFSCKKPQTCAKCAKEGHHHSSCQAIVFKCILCGGDHESFSKNCRVLYPHAHA